MTRTVFGTLVVCTFTVMVASARAQDLTPDRDGVAHALGKPKFSPYAGRHFPTRVLWGDTHLHTAISVDAGTMCRVGQEDAFRFARGEELWLKHQSKNKSPDMHRVAQKWLRLTGTAQPCNEKSKCAGSYLIMDE